MGDWSPADALALSPSNYSSWTGTVQLPKDTWVEWKCVKRDESDPNTGIEWQSGDNNRVFTGSGALSEASF